MLGDQFCIYQGSTPYLEIILPVDLGSSDIVYATFDQMDKSVIEYKINGTARTDIAAPTGSMARDSVDADTIIIHMSQADTLRLEGGEVLLQIRVKTSDGADTLIPIPGYVGKAQKGGTI